MSDTNNENQEENKNEDVMISFKKSFVPIISEGEYKVSFQEKINVKSNEKSIAADSNNTECEFVIGCDPFSILDADIYSCYPPKNSLGDYHNKLPIITFYREEIPWERKLDYNIKLDEMAEKKEHIPKNCNKYEKGMNLPWMTLLMFDETEGVIERELTYDEAFGKNAIDNNNTYIPEIKLKYDDTIEKNENGIKKRKYKVIDIPKQMFINTMPSINDLIYLSHVREVSVENKASHVYVTDGKFSSIIANRLPSDKEDAIKEMMYVVSLEGYGDYLIGKDGMDGKDKIENEKNAYVRMVVLTSWSYTTKKEEKYGFKELVDILSINYFGVDNRINIEDETIKRMLSIGYRPFNHRTREGLKTVSWYKSPFVPYVPKYCALSDDKEIDNVSNYECMNNPDALISYIEDIGMFDETYSLAWQIGKMLALSNKVLLGAIYDLRILNHENDIRYKNVNILNNIFDLDDNDNNSEEKLLDSINKKITDKLEQVDMSQKTSNLKKQIGLD